MDLNFWINQNSFQIVFFIKKRIKINETVDPSRDHKMTQGIFDFFVNKRQVVLSRRPLLYEI